MYCVRLQTASQHSWYTWEDHAYNPGPTVHILWWAHDCKSALMVHVLREGGPCNPSTHGTSKHGPISQHSFWIYFVRLELINHYSFSCTVWDSNCCPALVVNGMYKMQNSEPALKMQAVYKAQAYNPVSMVYGLWTWTPVTQNSWSTYWRRLMPITQHSLLTYCVRFTTVI